MVTYAEGLQFGLSVPRDALTPRVTNVGSLNMRPISRRTEALRLLMAYLKSALKEGALAAPKLRDAGTSFTERVNELRLQRAFAFAGRVLSDPIRKWEPAARSVFVTSFSRIGEWRLCSRALGTFQLERAFSPHRFGQYFSEGYGPKF